MTCTSPWSGGSLKGGARASRRTSRSLYTCSTPTVTRSKYGPPPPPPPHNFKTIADNHCAYPSLPFGIHCCDTCHTSRASELTPSRLSPVPPYLQDCISLGSGEPNTSEHRSFVLYHNNSPRWSEMVKLPIPIDRFRGSHLRFEFRHCSSEFTPLTVHTASFTPRHDRETESGIWVVFFFFYSAVAVGLGSVAVRVFDCPSQKVSGLNPQCPPSLSPLS